MDEGLVGGEGFGVDASLIEAEAHRQRSLPGSDWNQQRDADPAPRAVQEYLATLDHAAWGGRTEVEPKFVSSSDPAAQWTGAIVPVQRRARDRDGSIIQPMTLANMRENGVRSISTTCETCQQGGAQRGLVAGRHASAGHRPETAVLGLRRSGDRDTPELTRPP
jgi:hypothetical protein